MSLGCLIDFEGDFNNVTFNSVSQSCREHNIDITLTIWIVKMLRFRVVNSYLGSSKVSVYVSKGCPQGGI